MSDTTEIFGNPTGGLDVSDEALADKWQDDTSISDGGVDDLIEGTDDGEEVIEEGEEVVEEQPAEDQPGEPNVEKDEGEVVLPPELQGKSPEELARMVVEGQQLIGRHSNEVGEIRQQMQQMQMAFQQQLQDYAMAMMQVQNAPAIDTENLSYGEALDLLDQGMIGVDVIDSIIEDAYEQGDTREARQMERDFMYRMARAEAMQATNAKVGEIEQKYAPVGKDLAQRRVADATAALYSEQPEDAKAYEQDVVRVIKQPANRVEQGIAEMFEADPKAGLDEALKYARGADPTRSAAYIKALEASKAAAQVEGGASAEPADKPMSEADRVRASVFQSEHEKRLSALGL